MKYEQKYFKETLVQHCNSHILMQKGKNPNNSVTILEYKVLLKNDSRFAFLVHKLRRTTEMTAFVPPTVFPEFT